MFYPASLSSQFVSHFYFSDFSKIEARVHSRAGESKEAHSNHHCLTYPVA